MSEYHGDYLIVRNLCPSCDALKEEMKKRGMPHGLQIIDAKGVDGTVVASYTQTLGNTVPYIIKMTEENPVVFGKDENGKIEEQRMTEVRGALWGTE